MQLTRARHHHVQLIGGAIDEKVVTAALAQRFEVRQQRRTETDQDRDHDAQRHRPAVELQRIVEHPGVAAHDGVLDAAKQEAPAADLDLGGESKARHALLDDVQSCMDGVDRLGHVFAVDLAELLDAEAVEVHRPGQAHVPVLLTGLDQLPGVTTVARDVERRLAVERALVQQRGRLEHPLGRLLAER